MTVKHIKTMVSVPFNYENDGVMTYEDYLNEVTTLIYELYEVDEDYAVKLVVMAQDHDYFVAHDEQPAMRTQAQAEIDAELIYMTRGNRKN